MPFAVVPHHETRIMRAVASGTVSRDDVIEFLTEHWARLSPDWALLFDTADSTATYGPADVHDFVSRTIEVTRDRHPQLAFVITDPERRRFVRQYQLRCEIGGCPTIEVFSTIPDAEAWLAASRR